MPGGIDTDAIRRSWPDILAKVFTIRRTTWTFLSEHTQVLDYDGTRLLLGIQTEGLATTFRRGQHAELVRQALSEVLGVEAVVEAIATVQSERSGSRATAASPSPAPSSAVTPPPSPASPAIGPSAAPAPAPARPGPAPERASSPMQRARAAVAQEISTQETSTRDASASLSVAADAMVSADDEDIHEAVAVGQPVIARVLGGTVIGELDQ
jgi:DNA polymerase-3 subunit gamma/tau